MTRYDGPGVVTDPWAGYCTATLTRDAAIDDGFGETWFTVRAGEEFLVAESGFGTRELLDLTPTGPLSFEVPPDPETGDRPLTTSCAGDTDVTYYAAFTDVAVYADEGMTTKLCDLAAGTVLPDDGSGFGFAAGSSFSLDGPATYEVSLNAFSPQCGGGERGYISVPAIEVHGGTTWIVPITAITGPR
ncbi:MAG: hypothetical protein FJ034_08320 [Chloroflexi bacterium]|nr:hypothetical protein [Chloroflexota bacterium]